MASGPKAGAQSDHGPVRIDIVGTRCAWYGVPMPPNDTIRGTWPSTGAPKPGDTSTRSRARAAVASTTALCIASLGPTHQSSSSAASVNAS